MIVFPAVDIQAGKAVRLRQGDFDDVTVFSDDPVELARYWQDQGAEALHVIDLDAARTGELANFTIVERIVKALDIPVQYGGGVRSQKALALMAGIGCIGWSWARPQSRRSTCSTMPSTGWATASSSALTVRTACAPPTAGKNARR